MTDQGRVFLLSRPVTTHPVCVVFFICAVFGAGCTGSPVNVDDELGPSGAGIVRIEGGEADYALDEDASHFDLLLYPRMGPGTGTGTACALFERYHVVEAHGVRMSFVLDDLSDTQANAYVIVPVSELVIDEEEARLRHPQTAQTQEGDRVWLGEEMRNEELNAESFRK